MPPAPKPRVRRRDRSVRRNRMPGVLPPPVWMAEPGGHNASVAEKGTFLVLDGQLNRMPLMSRPMPLLSVVVSPPRRRASDQCVDRIRKN